MNHPTERTDGGHKERCNTTGRSTVFLWSGCLHLF